MTIGPVNADRMSPTGWFAIALGFALSVAALGYFFLPSMLRGLASESWPKTTGEVIKTGLNHHKDPKSGVYYTYRVLTRYTVDGLQFESIRIQFPELKHYSPEDKVRAAALALYPVGK